MPESELLKEIQKLPRRKKQPMPPVNTLLSRHKPYSNMVSAKLLKEIQSQLNRSLSPVNVLRSRTPQAHLLPFQYKRKMYSKLEKKMSQDIVQSLEDWVHTTLLYLESVDRCIRKCNSTQSCEDCIDQLGFAIINEFNRPRGAIPMFHIKMIRESFGKILYTTLIKHHNDPYKGKHILYSILMKINVIQSLTPIRGRKLPIVLDRFSPILRVALSKTTDKKSIVAQWWDAMSRWWASTKVVRKYASGLHQDNLRQEMITLLNAMNLFSQSLSPEKQKEEIDVSSLSIQIPSPPRISPKKKSPRISPKKKSPPTISSPMTPQQSPITTKPTSIGPKTPQRTPPITTKPPAISPKTPTTRPITIRTPSPKTPRFKTPPTSPIRSIYSPTGSEMGYAFSSSPTTPTTISQSFSRSPSPSPTPRRRRSIGKPSFLRNVTPIKLFGTPRRKKKPSGGTPTPHSIPQEEQISEFPNLTSPPPTISQRT